LRTIRTHAVAHDKQKKNPLKNRGLMNRLNPFDAKRRAAVQKTEDDLHKKRQTTVKADRKSHKKAQKLRRKTHGVLAAGLQTSFKAAEDEWTRVEKEGLEVAENESEEDEQ